MSYTPPAGNAANFILSILIPPAGNAANFEMNPSTSSGNFFAFM